MSTVTITAFPAFTFTPDPDGATGRLTANSTARPVAAATPAQLRAGVIAHCAATAARLDRPVLLTVHGRPAVRLAVWPDAIVAPLGPDGTATRPAGTPSALTSNCRHCDTELPVRAAGEICRHCHGENPLAVHTVGDDLPGTADQDNNDNDNDATVDRDGSGRADPAGAATPAAGGPHLARRDWPARWRRRALIGLGTCAAAAVAGLLWWGPDAAPPAAPTTSTTPTPIPTPTVAPAVAVASLPGWTDTAAALLELPGPANRPAVLLPGGDLLALVADDTALLVDTGTGERVDQVPLGTSTREGMYLVTVDGAATVMTFTADTIHLWDTTTRAHREVPVPAGSRVGIRGGAVTVTTDSTVHLLTGAGLGAVSAPVPGAALQDVTADGMLRWASARGSVLTATPAGDQIGAATLTAPDGHPMLQRWMGTAGPELLVAWASPDGSVLLAAHRGDGAVIGAAPWPAGQTLTVVTLADGSATLAGPLLVHHRTGTAGTAPVTGPLAGVGAEFYAATPSGPVLLGADGTIRAAGIPAVSPHGLTADGALVASDATTVYRFAPVKTSPSPDGTRKEEEHE